MSAAKHTLGSRASTSGPWTLYPFRHGFLVGRDRGDGHPESLGRDGFVSLSSDHPQCFFASEEEARAAIRKADGERQAGRANTTRASTITIYLEVSRYNAFTVVRDDGACAEGLNWEEMLGEVARMTLPEPNAGPRYLRTPEQAEFERDRRAARAAARKAVMSNADVGDDLEDMPF